jgi:hypothetical protein
MFVYLYLHRSAAFGLILVSPPQSRQQLHQNSRKHTIPFLPPIRNHNSPIRQCECRNDKRNALHQIGTEQKSGGRQLQLAQLINCLSSQIQSINQSIPQSQKPRNTAFFNSATTRLQLTSSFTPIRTISLCSLKQQLCPSSHFSQLLQLSHGARSHC